MLGTVWGGVPSFCYNSGKTTGGTVNRQRAFSPEGGAKDGGLKGQFCGTHYR